MTNPLRTFLDRHMGTQFVPNLSSFTIGIAQDFWKDGPANPLLFFLPPKRASSPASTSSSSFSSRLAAQLKPSTEAHPVSTPTEVYWHADSGEISEIMFGPGIVVPGGEFVEDKLVKPLGLTKNMSVLDLSAGLGTSIRKISAEYGAYVTGLEADPELASRAMVLSVMAGQAKVSPIDHYDMENLSLTRMYDSVLARDIFHKVADKDTFFKLVAVAMKPRAQIAFTDYILNADVSQKPMVQAWLSATPSLSPIGLPEMTSAWGKVGVKLRVTEDMTDHYKKDSLKGLHRLAVFLKSGVHPDPETKKRLHEKLAAWTHCLGAMDQGLKFYRFYGTKN